MNQIVRELRDLRKIETGVCTDILVRLEKVEREKIHLEEAYATLYEFCFQQLSYDKNGAYLRIRAVETLRIDPSVEKSCAQGECR